MIFHKLFSTALGIGYTGKGCGTLAAIFTMFLWLVALTYGFSNLGFLIATLLITGLGIWSSEKVIPIWGKDPQRVVIDEVAGMCITLLWLPKDNIAYLLGGLVLFRFFDIVKPLGIRKAESLNGGLGIMADDILAGVYANIVLRVLALGVSFL